MCGRYVNLSNRVFRALYGHDRVIPLPPVQDPLFEFDFRPTMHAPIIRVSKDGVLEQVKLRWWLVPSGMKGGIETAKRYPMFNARAETIRERPVFREAFKRRRCLVPMNGFLEFRLEGGVKWPYLVCFEDFEPFACAGVWDTWTDGNTALESFALITCEANEMVSSVHDRMPVILPRSRWQGWLEAGSDLDKLQGWLVLHDDRHMEVHPVSRDVLKRPSAWAEGLDFIGFSGLLSKAG